MGALRICSVLGINGTSLNQLTKTSYDDLQAGRDMVYGAFKSKYDEVEAWEKVIGPYDNQLNTKKRNALCDYILAREKQLYFKDRNDLYSFFLLDVEMSGCARASRVGAAISSLQLYVHRCLVNLEQSQDKAVTVLPSMIPPREWE